MHDEKFWPLLTAVAAGTRCSTPLTALNKQGDPTSSQEQTTSRGALGQAVLTHGPVLHRCSSPLLERSPPPPALPPRVSGEVQSATRRFQVHVLHGAPRDC